MSKLFLFFLSVFLSSVLLSQAPTENCEFARRKYLEINPDVAKAKMDPWSHYSTFGRNEGRAWPSCESSQEKKAEIEFKTNHNWKSEAKIKFSPSGKLIATSDNLDDVVNIWNTETGARLFSLSLNDNKPIGAFNFSNDEKFLVVGTNTNDEKSNYLSFWSLITGSNLYKYPANHGKGYFFVSFIEEASTVQVNDNGTYVNIPKNTITVGFGSKSVKFLNTYDGNDAYTPASIPCKNGIVNCQLSANKKYLALTEDNGSSVYLVTIREYGKIEVSLLESHTKKIMSVYFTNDNISLLTTSQDRTWKTWDLLSKENTLTSKLPMHADIVGYLGENSYVVYNNSRVIQVSQASDGASVRKVPFNKKIVSVATDNMARPSLTEYFNLNSEKYKWNERFSGKRYSCKDEKTAMKLFKLLSEKPYLYRESAELTEKFNSKSKINLEIFADTVEKDVDYAGRFQWNSGAHYIGLCGDKYIVIHNKFHLDSSPKPLSKVRSEVNQDYVNYINNIWPKYLAEHLKIAVAFDDGILHVASVDLNKQDAINSSEDSDFGINNLIIKEKGNSSHRRFEESTILWKKFIFAMCYVLSSYNSEVDFYDEIRANNELKRLSELLSQKLSIDTCDIRSALIIDGIVKPYFGSIKNELFDLNKQDNVSDILFSILQLESENKSRCAITDNWKSIVEIDAYYPKSDAEMEFEENQRKIEGEKERKREAEGYEREQMNISQFCYRTYKGKYELSLADDGSYSAYYRFYNSSGDLQKTLSGSWEIRDEGVYGTNYVMTISWSGANSSMTDIKFVCQYDGWGNLQNIIDSESRTWDRCN